MENEEFLWSKDYLGQWLRFTRMDRGYSQAQLSALSGVAPSEIHRVEVGDQECRIESLLKLCGPLGVTPAWILDRSFEANLAWLKEKILEDAVYEELLLKLGLQDLEGDAIAKTLACAAATAAIVLRASCPEERVSIVEFHDDAWKKTFIAFAHRLAAMHGDDPERATILHHLLSRPVAELARQGLIVESVLKEQLDALARPGKIKKEFLWTSRAWRISALESRFVRRAARMKSEAKGEQMEGRHGPKSDPSPPTFKVILEGTVKAAPKSLSPVSPAAKKVEIGR